MRRKLTLSSASTIKTTVFRVGRQESESTPESNLCYGLGGRHSHWKVSPRFRTLRSEIEQPVLYLGHFERVQLLEGEPKSTSTEHLGPSSKTRRPHIWLKNDPMVDSGPHPGVHQQGRLALKEPGPKSFWTFRCGSSSRARSAELLMILSRI